MGKTTKPRVICCTDAGLRATPEIQALQAKGHRILSWEETGNLVQPDLILGPNCRMMTPEMVKYVGLALKELGKGKAVLEEAELESVVSQPVLDEEDMA